MFDVVAKKLCDMNISIQFSEEAKKQISEIGYDPLYGARPLRRTIQSNIEDKLSELLLDNTFSSGDNILCTFKNNKFEFKKQ